MQKSRVRPKVTDTESVLPDLPSPVVVRTRDAIVGFNVLWLEGHLERNCYFAFFLMPPDLRNNIESSGLSLYECSISYGILKRSFASRILTTTSAVIF
jgi:hypothetical protein